MGVSQVEVDSLSSTMLHDCRCPSFCCESDASHPAFGRDNPAQMHVLPEIVPKRPIKGNSPNQNLSSQKVPLLSYARWCSTFCQDPFSCPEVCRQTLHRPSFLCLSPLDTGMRCLQCVAPISVGPFIAVVHSMSS